MRLLRYLALIVFSALAVVSLAYIVTKTLHPSGATDFHSYWYAGLFVRQGIDPYTAFLAEEAPPLPIAFVDGPVIRQPPVAQPGLARVPANTAALVELLTFFSFFSWPSAKMIWMAVNLGLMVSIVWLIWRLFPQFEQWPPAEKLCFGLMFVGLFGTRNIGGNGQTSFLIFAAMLAAVLAERRWFLSGLMLGVAMSKYSLALPVFLLFLLERKYREIVVAGLVQAVALLLLSAISQQSPWRIVSAYLQIFQMHTSLPGIHLANLFPAGGLGGQIAAWLLSLMTAAPLLYWLYQRKGQALRCIFLARQALLTIFMLWTLLVAYHRAYDTFAAILFIAQVVTWLKHAGRAKPQSAFLLVALALLVVTALTVPARGVGGGDGGGAAGWLTTWLTVQSHAVTLALTMSLAVSLWILYQLKTEVTHESTHDSH